jgi:hypothetical protein
VRTGESPAEESAIVEGGLQCWSGSGESPRSLRIWRVWRRRSLQATPIGGIATAKARADGGGRPGDGAQLLQLETEVGAGAARRVGQEATVKRQESGHAPASAPFDELAQHKAILEKDVRTRTADCDGPTAAAARTAGAARGGGVPAKGEPST